MPEFSNYVEGRPAAATLTGAELLAISQNGDAVQTTTQDIADLGAGGGGTVTSVTGTDNRITSTGGTTPVIDIDPAYDAAVAAEIAAAVAGLAPLASPALTGTPTAPTPSAADNDTSIATTAFVQGELANYVNEETFATLTYGATTNWDLNNRQNPLAKLVATGAFTMNMTSVKSGAQGILQVEADTAASFVMTFDTDFTNRDVVTGATLTTYTFPANDNFIYTNSFVVDGTTIWWVIGDYFNPAVTNPFAKVRRVAVQSIPNNDVTNPVSFDTEDIDNAAIFTSGSPTVLTIPGSGNKIATISMLVDFAVNTTGVRRVWVYINGAAASPGVLQAAPVATVSSTITGTLQVPCAAGDTIEIRPYQNSGGSLNVTVSCTIKVENR